jgi:hypothetical protein
MGTPISFAIAAWASPVRADQGHGEPRALVWRVVAKAKRSLPCPACATQRSSPANMCLRHLWRDLCMPSSGHVATAKEHVSPRDSSNCRKARVAWRHRDRSRARRLCIIYRASHHPPAMAVGSLIVEWCGTCHTSTTHDSRTKAVRCASLAGPQVWLDHLPSDNSWDRPRSTGRDRSL